MRRLLLALTLALAGCPNDHTDAPATDGGGSDAPVPPPMCPTGFLGDPSMPIQVEIHAIKADGSDVVLKDGDDLAIIFPPQGGRVAFVGIRATNLDGCGVQLTAALRDPISNQVRLDGRTVNLTREPDGWGTTGSGVSADIANSDAIAQYSNVPLCPNQWASQDIYDKTFQLEVIVTDSRKQKADVKMNVVPRCAEGGAKLAACQCLCKNGYSGDPCGEPIDGGK